MSEPKKVRTDVPANQPAESTETPVLPETPAPAPAPAVAAPAIKVRTVKIVNKFQQKIHLSLPDKTGKMVGIELSVGQKLPWTYQGDSLGPDFALKKRKGLVSLTP